MITPTLGRYCSLVIQAQTSQHWSTPLKSTKSAQEYGSDTWKSCLQFVLELYKESLYLNQYHALLTDDLNAYLSVKSSHKVSFGYFFQHCASTEQLSPGSVLLYPLNNQVLKPFHFIVLLLLVSVSGLPLLLHTLMLVSNNFIVSTCPPLSIPSLFPNFCLLFHVWTFTPFPLAPLSFTPLHADSELAVLSLSSRHPGPDSTDTTAQPWAEL